MRLAVAAVVAGDADVLMKGLVSTDKYMRGILNKDAGLFPPKGVLSHVAILEMPSLPQTALHLGRRGDPRARLQTETEADRIPHPDCQAAGHRHAENRLHRTLGTSAAERSVVDRRGHPGQNGRPRTIGQCDRRRTAVAGRSALQRRSPSTRKSRVRPSRAIPTACSSPTSNRPTSSSRQPRISAAPSWRPWSWERRFPACSPRAATRA